MAKITKKARLTVNIPSSNTPPSEFRIFKRGVNPTSKGDFLFDDEAAKLVMAAYRKAGTDIMLDLEHLSLDSEGENYDPDAYGWCKLEVRNGELWAVAVTWTEEGAARLQSKKSRYISPAFHFLTESGRVTEIYNIAICAVPATYETPALVAASKRVGKKIGTLTVEVDDMDIKKILAALGLKEDATLEEVLAAIKALTDGGGDEAAADDEEAADDAEPDGDESDDEDAATARTAAAIKDLPPGVQAELLAAVTQNKAMQARLAKLEKQTTNSARDTLIAANIDKLPKGLESWAKEQTVETLSAYFAKASPVRKEAKTAPARDSNTDEVKLTPEDLKVAKLTGAKPEDMLKQKKALAANRKQEQAIEAN